MERPENELILYTDGGCSGNPGPGGWGMVLIDPISPDGKKEITLSGGEKLTTNNQMELTAVIKGLSLVLNTPDFAERPVAVFTDSQYVMKGITEWISNWKKNNWMTASKKPVKNQELWVLLDKLVSMCKLHWIWVKGHAGIKYNEIVDQLTQDEIKKIRG